MNFLGRLLIISGTTIIILGLLLIFLPRLHLFRLPGDIIITKRNFTLYFPIATSIIVSLILTFILNLLLRR